MKNYPATFMITAICLAVMLLETVIPGAAHVLCFRPSDGVFGWLGLLTYQFAHGGWDHLLGNLTFGLPFMAYLESHLGRKKLVEFYVACGIGSALLNLVLAGPAPMIGASGSLFGVMVGACMAFGETLEEHLLALAYLLALLVPQIAMGPYEMLLGIAFWGHVGGGLTALLLSHRIHSHDPRVGF